MLKPDYYPLKQAAEILSRDESELIHFGACGDLPIYVLHAKFSASIQRFDFIGDLAIADEEHIYLDKPLRLSTYSLKKYEAGDSETKAGFNSITVYRDKTNIPIEQHKISLQYQHSRDTAAIKDCVMVVMADDLERLRQQTPQAGIMGDGGAGSKKGKRLKGQSDRLRTAHFIEWASRICYDGSQTHYYLQAELRQDNPHLWGKNEETFNKWIRTDEAIAAKELLDKLKLQARQAV